MADKSVGELIAAQSVTPTDLFVLEQNGTAKKLTGQILENWLVSFADGHGGIQSIVKKSTSGLVDTYRITLSDTTTFDFLVTNGRDVRSITKTGTSGLVDTYTILYNDNTSDTLTVTNGAKGEKGDNAYIWIKYASQEPTESSHSMGDIPDNWIGIYSGNASSAPSDWKQYKWFQIKGEKGDTGDAATILSKSVTYQVSDSGTIIPSGAWGSSIPVVAQGKYLWTKTELQFNSGDPIVSYSVARMGMDGTGSVSSVNNVSPDETGNVTLSAADVGALPSSGGDMTGEIRMNGQPVSGLNPPTDDTQAANKGYVDAAKAEAISHANAAARAAAPRNLLDNSDFRNPVMQAGLKGAHGSKTFLIDRWAMSSDVPASNDESGITIDGNLDLIQQFENYNYLAGKVCTFVAKVDGETKAVTLVVGNELNGKYLTSGVRIYSIPSLNMLIRQDSGIHNYEWVALYEGEYTAETLPEYQPKGYGAELAECKRYYQAYDENAFFGIAVTDADGVNFQGTIPCGEMRVKQPTIIGAIAAWDGTVSTGVSSVATVIWKGNGMRINGALSSNVTQGQFLMLYAASKVAFSADL